MAVLAAVRRLSWGALALLGFAGCSKDDILRPDVPDVIDPDALNNLQGTTAIYNGAISDLVFGTTGTSIGLVIYAGLFADEFMHAAADPGVRDWDLRNVSPDNLTAINGRGPFIGLHRARTALESGAGKLATLLPANDKRVGELWGLAGMTYILFGENFCSGTPFSERDPTIELGGPITTDEMFNRALDRLNTAAGSTGGDARTTNLTAVLRGRALLNLGQFSQAAQAVATVPTSFVYEFFHAIAPARQNNNIFLQNSSDNFSVSDREGTNGLNFASAGDPRVPASTPRLSRRDGLTPQVYFLKYTSAADPVAMVTGIEARLIEAEAALQANDIPGWLGKLNTARGTIPALGPLADPGSTAARVDLTFRERAFWMFLTGHRIGDLRRLVRQYGRAKESVYPTGAYHKLGVTHGPQATLRVPAPEENNPNYKRSDCTQDTP
ncbi:MAG TPA: hypothetical protein VGQ73_05885 [Gemmatimonadales bacterium]|nr:hypothetical protein [Gemmatimonadales bacterium]